MTRIFSILRTDSRIREQPLQGATGLKVPSLCTIYLSEIFVKNLCHIIVNSVHFDELLVTLHTYT